MEILRKLTCVLKYNCFLERIIAIDGDVSILKYSLTTIIGKATGKLDTIQITLRNSDEQTLLPLLLMHCRELYSWSAVLLSFQNHLLWGHHYDSAKDMCFTIWCRVLHPYIYTHNVIQYGIHVVLRNSSDPELLSLKKVGTSCTCRPYPGCIIHLRFLFPFYALFSKAFHSWSALHQMFKNRTPLFQVLVL